MAKYFEHLTLQPYNIETLKEAVIKEVVEDEQLKNVLTIKKVRNGDPLAIIGEMDAVGHAGANCMPTYKEIGIADALKRWTLKDWEIALKICYKNILDTMAEYSLKTGTPIADLDGTDFLVLFTDLLTKQVKRMFWRFAWFGDTAAATVADGGIITNGTDVTLMTAVDGLFKKLFKIATDNASQYTEIAANAEGSTAAQKAALRTAGVATGLVDSILMDANSMINANGSAILMLNKQFADALAYDVKKTYKDIMPWEKIFEGVSVAEYGGIKVASIATWDYMVNTYENDGTKLNKPFRAVFADPANLLLGVDEDQPMGELDIFFDKKDRQEYVYSTGRIDTMIAMDDLVHVAY